ncbi:MAG: hypothetical protein R3F49_25680 [Planctomycetota bacterium]
MTRSFSNPLRLLGVALVTTLALAPPLSAQAFKKERYPALGIPLVLRPRTFDPVPVQPNEGYVRLQWYERLPDPKRKQDKERRLRPKVMLVEIARPKVASGPKVEAEEGKEPEPRSRARGKGRGPVVDFESWLAGEFGGWTATDLGEGRKSDEYTTRQWRLHAPASDPSAKAYTGFAYTWADAARTFAVVGISAKEDEEEFDSVWAEMGSKLQLADPVGAEAEREKLERQYVGKYSHPDYRVHVAAAAIDPWKIENTENYIFVFNTRDQPLLRKVMRDIEALRGAYMELFPPAADFDAVSTVRICADKDEYMAYGGMQGSAGYWNSRTEELVLYHYEVQDGGRKDDANTFIVLYHEAFHQYIHYSSGELPPHSWFNEGYGDFFSGTRLKGSKVLKVDVNPWRCGTIQRAISAGRHVPWKDIIRYDQRQYYMNPAICYAQGWSMIYFLNRSKSVRTKPEWAKILPTYFETLKETYRTELERFTDEPNDGERFQAGQRAREAAVTAAFEGVDLDEIEREWATFTLALEDPRD